MSVVETHAPSLIGNGRQDPVVPRTSSSALASQVSSTSESQWLRALREYTGLRFELVSRVTNELLGDHTTLSAHEVSAIASELNDIFSMLPDLAQSAANTMKGPIPFEEFQRENSKRERLHGEIRKHLVQIIRICAERGDTESFPLLGIQISRTINFLYQTSFAVQATPRLFSTSSHEHLKHGDVLLDGVGNRRMVSKISDEGLVSCIESNALGTTEKHVPFKELLSEAGIVEVERRELPRLGPNKGRVDWFYANGPVAVKDLRVGDIASVTYSGTGWRLWRQEITDLRPDPDDPSSTLYTYVFTDVHGRGAPELKTRKVGQTVVFSDHQDFDCEILRPTPHNVASVGTNESDIRVKALEQFIGTRASHSGLNLLSTSYPLSWQEYHQRLGYLQAGNQTSKRAAEPTTFSLPAGTVCSFEDGRRLVFLTSVDSKGRALEYSPAGLTVKQVSVKALLNSKSKVSMEFGNKIFLIEGHRIDGADMRTRNTTPPLGAVLHYADGSREEIVGISSSSGKPRVVDVLSFLPGEAVPVFEQGVTRDWSPLNTRIVSVEVLEQTSKPTSDVPLLRDPSHTAQPDHPALHAFRSILDGFECAVATQCQEQINYLLETDTPEQSASTQAELQRVIQELAAIHDTRLELERKFSVLATLIVLSQPEALHRGLPDAIVSTLSSLAEESKESSLAGKPQIAHTMQAIGVALEALQKNVPTDSKTQMHALSGFKRYVNLLESQSSSILAELAQCRANRPEHAQTLGTELFTAESVPWEVIERCCELEKQVQRTPGVGDTDIQTQGAVFVTYSLQELFNELRSGALLDTYWVRDQETGAKRIEGFFLVYPPGTGSPEIQARAESAPGAKSRNAYASFYMVSPGAREQNIAAGKPGLAKKMLFASHFTHLQRYGTEYHVGYIEYENLASFKAILGQLGMPNALGCRVTSGPDGKPIPWLQMIVPIHPAARETARESTEIPVRKLIELFSIQASGTGKQ